MKEPTKADLATAVAKLTEENAGLRDLLAAVSECARAVPQAAAYGDRRQLSRATSVLIRISVVTDPGSTWVWSWGSGEGAAHLRELAAEPVDYEVYVKPKPTCRSCEIEPATEGDFCEACAPLALMATGTLDDDDEDGPMDDEAELRRADAVRDANPPHHITGARAAEASCLAEDGGYICNAQDGHDGPEHVAYVGDGEECHRWAVTADVTRDQPASPDAAEALIDAIVAGTPVKAADEPEPSLHQLRMKALHEGSPAVQDGPYAYMDRDA